MNEKYAKLSFLHEVSLIRLRTMILRCIGASINVSLYVSPPKPNSTANEHSHEESNGVDETISRHLDTFCNVIKELRETYKSILENPVEELPQVNYYFPLSILVTSCFMVIQYVFFFFFRLCSAGSNNLDYFYTRNHRFSCLFSSTPCRLLTNFAVTV